MAKRRKHTSGSVTLAEVCKLGTLAHNRGFTLRDARDYGAGRVIALFKRKKYLRKGSNKGELYPTKEGWKVIDVACMLHHGRRLKY